MLIRKLITVLTIFVVQFSFAQQNIDVEWINFKPSVDTPKITIKLGVKADSEITNVKVSVDDVVIKGINPVRNDGYNMIQSFDILLNEGTNTIKVTVQTKKGNKSFTNTVNYINPNRKNNDDKKDDDKKDDDKNNNIEVIDTDDIKQIKEMAYIEGNADALYKLGMCYLKGTDDVDKDMFESTLCFKKAAEQKHRDALYEYGYALIYGRGVLKDVTEGIKNLEEAGDMNQQYALLKLGECYEQGVAVNKDMEKAKYYYRKCTLKQAKDRLAAIE